MNDEPSSTQEHLTQGPNLLPRERRERPSRHGAVVGAALSEIERTGRGQAPEAPAMCATCAFREGCMTNQMASTVLVAFKCAIGADPALFACHHGLIDGEPTRPCGGWVASLAAPFDEVKRIAAKMQAELAEPTDRDLIREVFDAWVAKVDPENTLNDYERGRLYLRAVQAGAFGSARKDGSPPQTGGVS